MDLKGLVSKILLQTSVYQPYLEKEPESKTPEEWGLKVSPVLNRRDRGDSVRHYQEWLMSLGYHLPRFGADGDLGSETLSATRTFQDDHGLTAEEDCLKIRGVGPKTFAAIKEAAAANAPEIPAAPKGSVVVDLPQGGVLYDITKQHDGKNRQGNRPWTEIKGITLHQTATNLGLDPRRYANVSAHIGVPQDGKIILMNDLTALVWHGNGFNRFDVGIEIDGHFAGVEGNLSTYWKPASQPNRKPMTLSEDQAKGALAAIAWVMKVVKDHGGKVEYIHAHRQSSKFRASDPGSKVWQKVAMVAQELWGLNDGGPDFTHGGYSIPKEWNPSYTNPYRQW